VCQNSSYINLLDSTIIDTRGRDSPIMTEYKQCTIIIREDLKLSRGKLAVQVAYTAVSAAEQADSSDRRAWKDGGQKKIVLQVKDLSEMYGLKMDAEAAGLPVSLITDAGLTEIPPGTVTALGLGPGRSDKLDAVTGELRLV
jgi:PTH2 family peptidyl-tRNA hydrolase